MNPHDPNTSNGDATVHNAVRDAAMRDAVSDAVLAHLDDTPPPPELISSPPDMWAAIEARLTSRPTSRDVIPLRAASSTQRDRSRHVPQRWTPHWATLLVAASLLIVATAGVTYAVTMHHVDERLRIASSVTPSHGVEAAPMQTSSPAQTPAPSQTLDRSEMPGANIPVVQVSNGHEPGQGGDPDVYEKEIVQLQTVVKEKRQQLKPETIDIIEQNLKVIDEAIRQSRAALEKDPGSRLLTQQLDRARAKKIALLRIAALLPPSA